MTRTIVSIWPMPLVEKRPRYMPMKIYSIEAAPFDGYSVLKITDQQERCYVAADIHVDKLVSAEELAQDLVRDFRRLRSGIDGAIGVWVADQENPTRQEILSSPQCREARAEQDAMCRNLVVEARILKAKHIEDTISDKHFIAADYLKITGEDWQKRDMNHDSRKQCPFCGHFIATVVVKCTNCHEIVDPTGYAKLKAFNDSVLAAAQQQGEIHDNGGSAIRPGKNASKAEKEKELVGA